MMSLSLLAARTVGILLHKESWNACVRSDVTTHMQYVLTYIIFFNLGLFVCIVIQVVCVL